MREKEITRTLNLVRNAGKNVNNPLPGTTLDDLSLVDIFKKALRHKFIICFIFLVSVGTALTVYSLAGTWYQREMTAQFNNVQNNSFFQYIDSLVPGLSVGSTNSQDYASRAISALASDEFIQFVLQQAKEDKALRTAIDIPQIDKTEVDLQDKVFLKTRAFFNNDVTFRTTDVPGSTLLRVKSNGSFYIVIKHKHAEWVEKITPIITRIVSEFIAKREIDDINSTRNLIKEKIQIYANEISELVKKGMSVQKSAPSGSLETYRAVELAMQSARVALAGNKSLEARYLELVREIENKLLSVTDNATDTKDEEEVTLLRRELAGLSYQQKVERIQGVSPESRRMKALNDNLAETTEKLNQLLKDRKNRLLFVDPTTVDIISQEERLSEQLSTAEDIKEQNAFYKAKIDTLGQILNELKSEINTRLALELEKKEIDRLVTAKQVILDNLETAVIRLELADFKTVKSLEIFQGNIYERGNVPFGSSMFLSAVFGLLLGIGMAFSKERKNPSLRTLKSFEELGVPVLGGVPSTETFLFNREGLVSQDDYNSLRYVKLGINLSNVLAYMNSKITLFTGANSSRQSATICYNLAAYYARTGRRVLIVEADLMNNFICKLLGVPLTGGLSNIMSAKSDVDIRPFSVEPNLDVLSGDRDDLPAIYRLVSENFLNLLDELKKTYDYIFIHACPTLDRPEAADLSRYAAVSIVGVDAKQANIVSVEQLVLEMRLYLSKYSYFILENAEDNVPGYRKKADRSTGYRHASEAPVDLRKAG
jgi:hypothetical protein